MSKSTRSLVLAAAAASLFLAGCATQGTTDTLGGNTMAQPATPVVAPASTKDANACKGMSSCKGMMKKHKHHHHKAASTEASKETDSTAATTDAPAAQ